MGLNPPDLLRQLYDTAVRSASPAQALQAHMPEPPRGRTVVIGAGKAAGSMAHAFSDLWPVQAPLSGLVVTRYQHTPARRPRSPCRIEIVEAAHPVPDAAGIAAAERKIGRAHV